MTKKVSIIQHVEQVWDIEGYFNYFLDEISTSTNTIAGDG